MNDDSKHGKSRPIPDILRQLAETDEGLVIVDPHGDLAQKIAERLAEENKKPPESPGIDGE